MQTLLRWLCVLCLLSVLISLPALAQKGGGASGGGPKGGGVGAPPVPTGAGAGGTSLGCGPNCMVNNGYSVNQTPFGICNGTLSCPTTTPRPLPATPTRDDDTCFLPPVQGIVSPTVSVIRLEVPDKAKHEYDKACSEMHHRELAKAEEHLQKAIGAYSAYSAAWVLMGQVQEMDHRTDDAAESCKRAMSIDSNYAPAYLCLAHLMAGGDKWKELEELTARLLRLHPLNASNAYYYNALAYFNLDQLSSAETTALRGVGDTPKTHQPELHLLLARIYEKKGDRSSEIEELKEYLKRSPHSEQADQASSTLKAITQNNAPAPKPQ